MAERVLQTQATIPAGTPQSAPVTIDLGIDNWEIEAIGVKVPSGPNGVMGVQVANNGVTWVPRSSGQYLVWNDHEQTFYLQDQPVGGGWQVIGYNEGDYDHTVYVSFHVAAAAARPPQPVVLTFTTSDTTPDQQVTL